MSKPASEVGSQVKQIEMGKRIREFDWSATEVGARSTWPQTLKTSVDIVVNSKFPMLLLWGNNLIQFYNDAFRSSLDDEKHPAALARSVYHSWPERKEAIERVVNYVRTTGDAFHVEDKLIPIVRNGALEQTYWTYCYSAIHGENDSVDGILVVCEETTAKVTAMQEMEYGHHRLEHNADNLRNVIDNAPVAMALLYGSEARVQLANERMYKLWGKPGAAFENMPIFDVLVEAKNEGFDKIFNKVFETGESYSAYGAKVTLFEGDTTRTAYVHFLYEPYRDRSGKVTGVMVVAIDVTEELISRERLTESEHRVRAIVESAPFPIGVYRGREMRIELLNKSIIDVWGKGTDLIGKTYAEVLPELKDQNIYPQLERVFDTGVPFHARNQRVDIIVDGKLREFYFNYSFTPLYDAGGNIYGVMNTAAEVTDIVMAKKQVEQSERNFRSMVAQAPVAMSILLGPEHVIEVASNLIVDLWGKPRESMMGLPVFEALPDAKGQGLEKLLQDVYETGIACTANEMPVQLIRNGKHETVYQNFVYEPYRDADGKILGVLAITNDVTPQVIARQKIEEVVRERTKQLQQSNEELSQFAYITSHDLQEPARKVTTFVDMLRASMEERIDARSAAYLDKIDASAQRMLSLIRDVLAVSQLSKSNAEFKRVDLGQVFREVIEDYELLIQQKGCMIETDHLPVLAAIPVQMNQLFNNLISNALKFTREGHNLRLKIRCSTLAADAAKEYTTLRPAPGYYKLDFVDNGIGFPPEKALQIFDIFQRLHTRQQYAGTGIGLAMCKKIAENHGGHIFATSVPGEGATFTVILPANQN